MGRLTALAAPLVPCSHQDGTRPAEQLSEYAAKKQLQRLPSLLEFYSYLFAAGNLLAGPFFEARDFFDYVDRKAGHRRRLRRPSPA